MKLYSKVTSLLVIVILALAVAPGFAEPSANYNRDAALENAIYRNLEYQATFYLYLVHKAEVEYKEEHGHWAEYKQDLVKGGYLSLPTELLPDTHLQVVSIHGHNAAGNRISDYEATINVSDSESGLRYVANMDQHGKILEVVGPDSVNPTHSGCIWPKEYLVSSLPATIQLKAAIEALGTAAP